MLGLYDRVAIREALTEKKTDKKEEKKDARGKPEAKPADAKPKPEGSTDAAKRDDKPADAELSPDDAADNDTPQTASPEKRHAPVAGSTNFATSAGWNSTPRRSKSWSAS